MVEDGLSAGLVHHEYRSTAGNIPLKRGRKMPPKVTPEQWIVQEL
jgi:hypothetical protein